MLLQLLPSSPLKDSWTSSYSTKSEHAKIYNQVKMLPSCLPSHHIAIDCAVHSQSAIGGSNLFQGLISLSWGPLFSDVPEPVTQGVSGSTTTINYLAVVIRALQDYSLSIWKSRNDALHQNTESSIFILHAQLNHKITAMYDQVKMAEQAGFVSQR